MSDRDTLLKSTRGACLPWNGPDALPDFKWGKPTTADPRHGYRHKGDTQREIDMCLNCKRPRCVNCME